MSCSWTTTAVASSAASGMEGATTLSQAGEWRTGAQSNRK